MTAFLIFQAALGVLQRFQIANRVRGKAKHPTRCVKWNWVACPLTCYQFG
ncbi:hypothetical protein [Kingella sp. (in: b-proteobacteria)]|nr:hypothetical protein [Kingella sp. (in: b-proteobacteria)]